MQSQFSNQKSSPYQYIHTLQLQRSINFFFSVFGFVFSSSFLLIVRSSCSHILTFCLFSYIHRQIQHLILMGNLRWFSVLFRFSATVAEIVGIVMLHCWFRWHYKATERQTIKRCGARGGKYLIFHCDFAISYCRAECPFRY